MNTQEAKDAELIALPAVADALENTICEWQKRARGASSTCQALVLADEFSEACRNGKPIPAWVLAIRSLAGSYRRARSINKTTAERADDKGGEKTEKPTPDAEHVDADGIEIEKGREYWVEVHQGGNMYRWVRARVKEVLIMRAYVRFPGSCSSSYVEFHRLHRRHPDETEKPDKPSAANPHNPRPSRDKIIDELTRECAKTKGWDGNTTRLVRIWLIRRALEWLTEDSQLPIQP